MNKKTIIDYIHQKLCGKWITDGKNYLYCSDIFIGNIGYTEEPTVMVGGYHLKVEKGERSFHYSKIDTASRYLADVVYYYEERDVDLKTRLNKILAKHNLIKE